MKPPPNADRSTVLVGGKRPFLPLTFFSHGSSNILPYHSTIPFYRTIPSYHSIVPFYRIILPYHSIVPFYGTILWYHSMVSFYRTILPYHSIVPFYRAKRNSVSFAYVIHINAAKKRMKYNFTTEFGPDRSLVDSGRNNIQVKMEFRRGSDVLYEEKWFLMACQQTYLQKFPSRHGGSRGCRRRRRVDPGQYHRQHHSRYIRGTLYRRVQVTRAIPWGQIQLRIGLVPFFHFGATVVAVGPVPQQSLEKRRPRHDESRIVLRRDPRHGNLE